LTKINISTETHLADRRSLVGGVGDPRPTSFIPYQTIFIF